MDTIAYVYKWTHIPTYKWYIGSRTAKGCHPDDGYTCSSKYVNEQINLYPNDWKREIIATGLPEEMYELETEILQLFDASSDPMSFNKNNNYSGFNFYKARKYQTEASKQKRIVSLKKTLAKPEIKKKYSELSKGRKHTQETKDKISERQMGSGNSMYGKEPAIKGKNISEEHRSATQRGILTKWQDPEYRQKVIQGQTKPEALKKRSESIKKTFRENPEIVKKFADSHRGHKHTDESKEKMRIAHLGKSRKVNILTCPHCNKVGALSQMKRWHFDNCKLKNSLFEF